MLQPACIMCVLFNYMATSRICEGLRSIIQGFHFNQSLLTKRWGADTLSPPLAKHRARIIRWITSLAKSFAVVYTYPTLRLGQSMNTMTSVFPRVSRFAGIAPPSTILPAVQHFIVCKTLYKSVNYEYVCYSSF